MKLVRNYLILSQLQLLKLITCQPEYYYETEPNKNTNLSTQNYCSQPGICGSGICQTSNPHQRQLQFQTPQKLPYTCRCQGENSFKKFNNSVNSPCLNCHELQFKKCRHVDYNGGFDYSIPMKGYKYLLCQCYDIVVPTVIDVDPKNTEGNLIVPCADENKNFKNNDLLLVNNKATSKSILDLTNKSIETTTYSPISTEAVYNLDSLQNFEVDPHDFFNLSDFADNDSTEINENVLDDEYELKTDYDSDLIIDDQIQDEENYYNSYPNYENYASYDNSAPESDTEKDEQTYNDKAPENKHDTHQIQDWQKNNNFNHEPDNDYSEYYNEGAAENIVETKNITVKNLGLGIVENYEDSPIIVDTTTARMTVSELMIESDVEEKPQIKDILPTNPYYDDYSENDLSSYTSYSTSDEFYIESYSAIQSLPKIETTHDTHTDQDNYLSEKMNDVISTTNLPTTQQSMELLGSQLNFQTANIISKASLKSQKIQTDHTTNDLTNDYDDYYGEYIGDEVYEQITASTTISNQEVEEIIPEMDYYNYDSYIGDEYEYENGLASLVESTTSSNQKLLADLAHWKSQQSNDPLLSLDFNSQPTKSDSVVHETSTKDTDLGIDNYEYYEDSIKLTAKKEKIKIVNQNNSTSLDVEIPKLFNLLGQEILKNKEVNALINQNQPIINTVKSFQQQANQFLAESQKFEFNYDNFNSELQQSNTQEHGQDENLNDKEIKSQTNSESTIFNLQSELQNKISNGLNQLANDTELTEKLNQSFLKGKNKLTQEISGARQNLVNEMDQFLAEEYENLEDKNVGSKLKEDISSSSVSSEFNVIKDPVKRKELEDLLSNDNLEVKNDSTSQELIEDKNAIDKEDNIQNKYPLRVKTELRIIDSNESSQVSTLLSAGISTSNLLMLVIICLLLIIALIGIVYAVRNKKEHN